ncbi:MAG TPA: acylphosphatase [Candidatus Lokiarchaeia archaeon]|nr:acylphosphatase [Candidatus Lokiarchaeia archaeon]
MGFLQLHAFVSGYVQGVFFRATTEEEANALGLGGWVRNLRDGRVEVLAEGEQADVERLEAWLWHGPPGAQVQDVAVEKKEIDSVSSREFKITF